MRRHRKLLRRIFVAEAYRTYGNLSRFFIRVFAGVMFMQFGIRQIANYDFFVKYFPDLLGMGSAATLDTMIAIEVVCSAFLIFGFLTRLSVVLPTLSMAVAEWYILDNGLMAGIANMPMGEVAPAAGLRAAALCRHVCVYNAGRSGKGVGRLSAVALLHQQGQP